MVSAIDPSQPVDGFPADKTVLRANLQAAKTEIETLQSGKANLSHNHTLSDVTDAGTAAAANTGTAPGNVPVLDVDGDIPLSMLGKVPSGGASNDVVDVADTQTLTLGALNRVASAAAVTVPDPATNANKVFGVFLATGGSTGSLSGGLSVSLTEPGRARTYASNGTTWDEYFGAEAVATTTPNIVRLTGVTEAVTLAKYNNAIVIVESGTQILNVPVSDEGAYFFRGLNGSGNVFTIGGVSIPDGEVFSALVDGTTMTARNVW